MLELLRKHQHGIMIVVAFLVIIAFAWLLNPYDNRQGSLNAAVGYTIGKQAVTVKEVDRQLNMLRAADQLGMTFTMQLLQPSFDAADFSQNRIILAREARELGLDPSEEEVNAAIAALPKFQRNGAYSKEAYLDSIENTLKPNGLVAGDLRGLIADKIRWEKLSALVSTGAAVPDSVIDMEFQSEREFVTAQVVDFKVEDFKAGVTVSDEELQQYYDEQKALVPTQAQLAEARPTPEQTAAEELIMAEEQRKVEFVFITEPAAPMAPRPVAPGLTPPPLLQPGTPMPNPTGLTAPPIEIPAPESEPPGQAPDAAAAIEEVAAPLGEAAAALEAEPLPAAPGGELELKPAEDLNLDVNVGGLDGEAAPQIDFGGATNLDLGGPAPDISLPGGGTLTAVDPAAGDFEEKIKAYKKQVDGFYNKVLETPGQFASLAQAEGFEVKTTGLFTEQDPSPEVPAELAAEIFNGNLAIDGGLLVPVQGITPKGFYVARLLEVVESAERSLEDAKEDLREKLINKKAKEAMDEAVKSAREKIMTALESGKSFGDAAKELELTTRSVDEFSSQKRPTVANASEIVTAVATVTTGSVSELVEAGDDALLVHVTQRVAASEVKDEAAGAEVTQPGQPAASDPVQDKKNLADRLERSLSSGLSALWLSDQRASADINVSNVLGRRQFLPASLFGGRGGFGG